LNQAMKQMRSNLTWHITRTRTARSFGCQET